MSRLPASDPSAIDTPGTDLPDPELPASKLIEEIKGFMDPDEGQRLFEIATQAARLGPGLEIGSYCGKSTLYLGTGFKRQGSALFTIDHHRGSIEQQPGEAYFDPELYDDRQQAIDTLPWLRRTLDRFGLTETVVPMVCASTVAARTWATPLGLVFVDGGHAYEDTLSDVESWAPHLCPGGYLLIHDLFEDPRDGGQAPYQVYEGVRNNGRFDTLARTKSLGVLRVRS